MRRTVFARSTRALPPKLPRLTLVTLLLATAAPLLAQSEPTSPKREEFKLIAERNIFNPNRTARSARSEQSRAEPERPPRRESLALLGTLQYAKGDFAVFGGSESEFRKVVKVSDQVGGCKLLAVGTEQVTLEHDGKEIELRVGMQMERQEKEPWKVTGAAQPQTRSSTSNLASVTSKPASSPAEEDNDVLKRLLERRSQQKNQ